MYMDCPSLSSSSGTTNIPRFSNSEIVFVENYWKLDPVHIDVHDLNGSLRIMGE